MPKPPWSSPSGVRAVLEQWQASGTVKRCFAAERSLPAATAEYGEVPSTLPPALRDALTRRGIASLYSHQAQAVNTARAGRHVVIATPTASGKSLCFHLPVLAALTEDTAATALFVYPTKALSRDQEHNLRELMGDAGLGSSAMVFDGDTPGDARRAVRERGRIVLTNPDMLHAGILPNHARWATLFQGLRYVVSGRAARLRQSQGLRAQGRARLLHHRPHLPHGQRDRGA
ncbi:MAG TPA: DEAD/DEAH box helicase [Polyangiaceae bacterium]|nr:DEAD/DEAH box helicase [Polyangiaceae bacterium]